MKQLKVSVPELVFVAATRGVLGAGIGLLLAERMRKDRRRALGWTLAAVGALSTIPAAAAIAGAARGGPSRSRRRKRRRFIRPSPCLGRSVSAPS